MADRGHLPGQKISEDLAICRGIIVAALFMRQQRPGHFLGNIGIDVVLGEIRDRGLNYTLTLSGIQSPIFESGNQSPAGCSFRPGLQSLRLGNSGAL